MTCYILVYDSVAMFEITLLAYLLNTKKLNKTIGLSTDLINTMEGMIIKPDYPINSITLKQDDMLVITGGDISKIKHNKTLRELILSAFEKNIKIATICAGIDLLADIVDLSNYKTIKNTDKNYIKDQNIISAKPEAYVDFAIEIAKILNIFSDEDNYKETYTFFKNNIIKI